ncbi:MAG: response regulator, partial [Proteobacteria bacterium]
MTAGKRVLLVDDESEIRDMIRDSLYALDLSFSDANNGLEALELLRAEHFDLVITDYNMPKMNGLQLVKEMQSAGFNIPTMWLTGRGTDALYKEACRYGVTDYIDKPFVLKTLQD